MYVTAMLCAYQVEAGPTVPFGDVFIDADAIGRATRECFCTDRYRTDPSQFLR